MLPSSERVDGESASRCHLQLHVPHVPHADALTAALQPLLAGLDPYMTHVQVMTPSHLAVDLPGAKMATIEMLVRLNCSFNGVRECRLLGGVADGYNGNCDSRDERTTSMVRTPALSVMLFLKETMAGQGGTMSAGSALRHLQKGPPWTFHHKIELSNARGGQMRVIGRQEFYSLDLNGNKPGGSGGHPLWAVCPIHCGNEQLRFTIFTQHFGAMVDFYRLLVGHEAEFTRPNFCLFTVTAGRGGVRGPVDIQLAVKKSPQLEPVPSTTAFLTWGVPSIRHLEALVHTPNGTAGTLGRVGTNLWLLRDPDSNCVLVQQTGPHPVPRSPPDVTDRILGDVTSGGRRTVTSLTFPDRQCPPHPLPPRTVPLPPSSCTPTPLQTLSTEPSPRRRSGPSGRPRLPARPLAAPRRPPPRCPWTDLSSGDSGWHSGRSDPDDTAPDDDDRDVDDDNRSTTSAATATTTTTTGVLLCDCDVTSDGLCVLCTGSSTEEDNITVCDVTRETTDFCDVTEPKPSLPPRRRVREEVKVKVRRRPWEVDDLELSSSEWDDLVSLTAGSGTTSSH